VGQLRGCRAARFLVMAFLAIVIVIAVGCRQLSPSSAEAVPLKQAAENIATDETTIELKLHFIENGHEEIERRQVPATLAVARAAILELAKGRFESSTEQKVLPPGTRLRDIAILDGIAYVDFSREFRDNHWGSLASELDTIYSVVNTLAEFKTVRAVQFLLEGSPIDTIGAGVVDLAQPVRPSPMMPERYAQVSAELQVAAGPQLPWSSWISWEERVGFKVGFPDRVLAADTDGDGADELIIIHDKLVTIWKRQNGAFQQVWERKFNSQPRALVASVEGGQSKHLVIGTAEGLYIFAWDKGNYNQLAWQGIGGTLVDLAVGDTTGTGQGQILALIGTRGRSNVRTESTSIVIWEWNGETYIMQREVNFSAHKILVEDITGDGIDEVLAINKDGLTVFSWQGAAYVEVASNPGAGVEHAAVLTADLTGDGRPELIIRDGQSPYLYIYTWQQGALRKLWQGAPSDVGLGWEIFAGIGPDNKAALIASTQEPGYYMIYQQGEDGWEKNIITGSGSEEILALADVDGDGTANIIFRRWQLLSSPTKWIYVGWPSA
jgi:germination protein M